MKKLLSILLVTAMLLSLVVVATSAEFDNTSSGYTGVPTGVEFKSDTTVGNYLRVPFIQSVINSGATAKYSALDDTTKRYIVIESKWYLPEVAKDSNNIVMLQFRKISSGDWCDFFEIEVGTGTVALEGGAKRTATKLNYNAWNTVRVVMDRETATECVYVNDKVVTMADGTSTFAIQKATAGFTIPANQLFSAKAMDNIVDNSTGKRTQVKTTASNFATTYDATFTDTTAYVDFQLVDIAMTNNVETSKIASYPPVYSTGTDGEIGNYIHVPYVSGNYDKYAMAQHDAVTAESGRYIVIDTELYISKNDKAYRTQMQFRRLTPASGSDAEWSSLIEIRTSDGEVYLTDYTSSNPTTTIKDLFKVGEWNNIRVVVDRVNYTRKVIINNTLCQKSDGTSDFVLEKGSTVGANFTVKANQLIVAKIQKYNISSASVLDATETDTTPYVNFHLNSFETCDITKLVGYQVSDTDTTKGTYNARLVATLKLPSAFTLQDLSSVGFKVTATYGENGSESKTVTKTTTNVYSSVAGYTKGETEVQAYTADALGGDYLFVLPILNIPTSAGTVTLKVTTFCTFGTGEIVASEQTVTIDTTNTSLD